MNRELLRQALDIINYNTENLNKGMSRSIQKLQAKANMALVEDLEAELAKPEIDYPRECTTPEMEVAYAAGWYKSLEVNRNKKFGQEPAVTFINEGDITETDVYTKQKNLSTSEERVQKSDKNVLETALEALTNPSTTMTIHAIQLIKEALKHDTQSNH